MEMIAFCFPGQGSLEEGMGRDIAELVPEAMEVYRVGSEASGLDLRRLCFEAPLHELVQTDVQQPALVATSLAVLAALRARGLAPDSVVGRSVSSVNAAWRWPKPRARATERWRRSSGSTTRSSNNCARRSRASGRRTT